MNLTNQLHSMLSAARRPGAVGLIGLCALMLTVPSVIFGDAAQATAIGLGSLNGPNGFPLDGGAPGDQAGSAAASAGDVNGDGLDDFIIGAPAAAPNGIQGAGEAYVVFGRITNPAALPLDSLNGSNGFRLTGATYNDEVGRAVHGAGDVNGDGYDDLIVGAPGADPNDLEEAGAAYVVFGRASFPPRLEPSSLNGANGFRIHGIDEDNRVGTSVGGAGDVNGDGYDDLLIGAPNAAPGGTDGKGQAYVVFGGRTFAPQLELAALDGDDGFQINGVAAESYAGRVVDSAGDVNGDGYDDVLITVGRYLTSRSLDSGTTYVLFGRAAFTAKINLADLKGASGFRLEGVNDGDNAGRSAAPAGDVNGDGRDDFIIGAPYADDRRGEVYVVFGQTSFPDVFNLVDLNGANGFRLIGDDDHGEAGMAVGAADVNGDGLDDVLIGASAAGTGISRFAGKTYVVFGRATFSSTVSLGTLDPADGLQFDGQIGGDQSGQSVGPAGDINGDGYDEFLIGAPNAGAGVHSNDGRAYLVQGGPTLGAPVPVTHTGTPDDDTMNGGAGNDVMLGGRGRDHISGAGGDDALKGGSDHDMLIGGPGGDRLIGGNGHDLISYAASPVAVTVNLFTRTAVGGDATGDRLRAVEGVIGSAGADTLTGDAEDNRLEGGGGDDLLTGGRGDDAFAFAPQGGNDTVTDFQPGAQSDDYLDFTAYPVIMDAGDLVVQPQGSDTVITLPGNESIRLIDVSSAALHPDDYRFVGAPLAIPDTFNTPAGVPLVVAAPGVLGNDDNPTASPLTASLVVPPAHGDVSLQPSGGFTYTPDTGFVGTDEFTYRANNGQLSNVARVTIDVTLVPPTAIDDAYTVELGGALVIAAPGVLGNDDNPGGLPLVAAVVEQPINGTLVFNENGSFTYTPEVDLPTQDSFTYRADNGLLSNEATVSLTILDPDGPPVAVNDRYTIETDGALNISAPGVLANDVNPLPGAMTAKLAENAAHGSLTLRADGSFTYVPQAGFEGIDSFTYQADNGQRSNEATVTLIVGVTEYRIQLPAILGN